jgi:hypothetical protein
MFDTRNRLVMLVIAGVCGLGVVVLAADAPSTSTTRPADLAALQQERIEILRQLLKVEELRVSTGRSNAWAEVGRRRRMLLEAELDASESPVQRLALLRAEVEASQAAEERAKALHEHGTLTHEELLEAKACRVDAEIRLMKEADQAK